MLCVPNHKTPSPQREIVVAILARPPTTYPTVPPVYVGLLNRDRVPPLLHPLVLKVAKMVTVSEAPSTHAIEDASRIVLATLRYACDTMPIAHAIANAATVLMIDKIPGPEDH